MSSLQLRNLLLNKNVFVFDWDGTVFDSMPLKTENFAKAFLIATAATTKIEAEGMIRSHYRALSGRPRKEIFHSIVNLMDAKLEPGSFDYFNKVFKELNTSSIGDAHVFPDAISLINELICCKKKMYISSSVPPMELREIVEAALPASITRHLLGVLGSEEGFSKGPDHINLVLNECNVPCDEIIVFGDDIADFELSSEAEVDCVLIARSDNTTEHGLALTIDTFTKISEVLHK